MDTEIKLLTFQIEPLGLWHLTFFIGITAFIISEMFRAKSTRLVKCLWAYVLVYSLVLFEFPYPFYGVMSRSFGVTAAQVFVEVIFIPIAAICYSRQILKCLPLVVILEALSVMIFGYGLMKAPSFDNAFIALCFPFVPWWAILPGLVSILTHHGGTAIMIVASQLFASGIVKRKWKTIVFTGALALVVPIELTHDIMWGSDSRIQAWKSFMSYWAKTPNRVAFGTGPGSFIWHGLAASGFKSPVFMALHSDWLQIVFETGLIGFVLAVGVTTEAFLRVRKSKKLLAALFGAVTFGLTYHPLRFFPSALVTALIFYLCLIEDAVKFDFTDSTGA